MIEIHLKKYYKNYLFILFVIGSFVLSTIYEKKGHTPYYVIAIVVFILGFTNFSFIKELGLSFKILKDKKTYIFVHNSCNSFIKFSFGLYKTELLGWGNAINK